MKAGYGQLFLLLLAIGAIFLATSGKGFAVWQVLTGSAAVGVGIGETKPLTPQEQVKEWDKAGSGSGGVMS